MRRRLFIGFASAALALVALLVTVVLEMIVAAILLPPGIGWDPVSLWNQSVRGKLFVVVAIGLPVCIPLLVFILVFVYVLRHLSGQKHTPSSMQNPAKRTQYQYSNVVAV